MSFDEPSRRAFLAGSVVAVGAGGAYYLTRSDESHDDESHGLSPEFHASDETSTLGVELAGKPIMGSPEAPIDLYYWTDFQCPFCAQFERETLPDLVREYVDPGRIRVVFVTVPFFGGDSMTAAVASRCVWEQVQETERSAYWNWHAAVFDEQGEKNSGWAAADNLVEYTRSVSGVDADALATCLDERRSTYEEEIDANAAQARSFGISGTPAFLAFDPETEAGEALAGAQPIDRFEEAIEAVEDA
ncbi:DsbA family protein [Halosolutus amylolyticus]|uniref:DsbA family protein n=1 Tax=Halosolutus amylolyticus TaxID=2932267 RepID=A0ABD5PMU7_9EURY|nr:thioredoxin domain-containing protein [Halosolutus amylolyticus]